LLAVGRKSTVPESLRSSVATGFAFAVVAVTAVVAGTAFEALSSVANCSAVGGALVSSAAAGSALGQVMGEFVTRELAVREFTVCEFATCEFRFFAARRGTSVVELAATADRRFAGLRATLVTGSCCDFAGRALAVATL
jgi:hypothetical protein